TISDRGPHATVITRRVLDTTAPRGTLPAETATTETVETVETVTPLRETTGSATITRAADNAALRGTTLQPARPAVQKQKRARTTAPMRNAPVRSAVVRNAPPRSAAVRSSLRTTTGAAPAVVEAPAPAPVLTTAQRSTLYRTIVEERVVPRTVVTERSVVPFPFGPPVATSPAVQEGVGPERGIPPPAPVGRERVEVAPAPRVIETVGAASAAPIVAGRVVTAPAAVELAVGTRVPATVPLYALPQSV